MTGGTASASSTCRLGVLAFGDSITNGGGELQWGVALQSWALWVARGLALPFTSYAFDGARVHDVVEGQIPAFERLTAATAPAGAGYQLGCLYIGVNDVRSPDWDAAVFEEGYRRALRFLFARCDRVLTVTAPLDLGRPLAAGTVAELDAVIERVAGEVGALVLDLRAWGARNLVMTDHVHPTAFGQIDIAERALAVLGRDGVEVLAHPSRMIFYAPSRRERLRGDVTYAYRHAKVSARSGWLRARVAFRGRC
ncbi:MAG TPA: GDSL-type esterase/lipase family protein [Solirubrobacteraceae bacterium]|nr:GDSL-type esterase/lipase family protein [Solirubrobacteraceae bacterium]